MFNKDYSSPTEMFGLVHIITLIIIICLIVAVVKLSKKVKLDSTKDRFIRYTAATILLTFELTYIVWAYGLGDRIIEISPFVTFCGITNMLTIIYLYTNNKKLANFVFYYALTGTFFAVIFVEVDHVFPHFRFFHYFGVHTGFMLVAIYNYMIGLVKINRKNFNLATLFAAFYAVFIIGLDYSLKENWFYFRESPVVQVSNFFGPYFYPPLWMLAIYLLLNVWYFIFKSIDKKRNILQMA